MSLYPSPTPTTSTHPISIPSNWHHPISYPTFMYKQMTFSSLQANIASITDTMGSVYIVCSNNVILYYLCSHGVMINPISQTSVGISEDWTPINRDEVQTDTDCRLSQRYILIDTSACWHCYSIQEEDLHLIFIQQGIDLRWLSM